MRGLVSISEVLDDPLYVDGGLLAEFLSGFFSKGAIPCSGSKEGSL